MARITRNPFTSTGKAAAGLLLPLCLWGCEKPAEQAVCEAQPHAHALRIAEPENGLVAHCTSCAECHVESSDNPVEDQSADLLELAQACSMLADGSTEEKCRALEDLPELEALADGEDDEAIRRTIVIMTAALNDPEEDVRSAAFNALLALPDASRRALSLQALGNDDVEIKLALLEMAAAPQDEFELTFNFQALDAEESEVRAQAAENIRGLCGREFATTEDAFAWWEQDPQARALSESFQNTDREQQEADGQ